MKNFKHVFLVGVLSALTTGINPNVHAAPRSNAGIDYLARNPSLGRLSVGIYAGTAEREVVMTGSRMPTILSSSRAYGYIGYNASRWASIYGILGTNEAEWSGRSAADSEMLFGAGLSLNLLNHFLREPTPLEDAIRVNGDLRIISTESEYGMNTISWQEFSGSIRVSLVNVPQGDKAYRPEAIALYAGPAFSLIDSSDMKSEQEFGIVGGLEIFLLDSLSIDLSVENFGETSVFAGLNLLF